MFLSEFSFKYLNKRVLIDIEHLKRFKVSVGDDTITEAHLDIHSPLFVKLSKICPRYLCNNKVSILNS